MKKIFFLLLLPISVFAKGWDTIPRLMIKASLPALINDNVEFGGMIEYKYCRNKSLEIGGGFISSYFYGNDGKGFTLKIDFRNYTSKGFYQSPLLFFRHQKFQNRYFAWNHSNEAPSGINETSDLMYVGDHDKRMVADEKKMVFGFEYIFGKEFIVLKYFTFEIYGGPGLRLKLRNLAVSSENYIDSPSSFTYYNPPKQATLNSGHLTIQFGFRIGLAFKVKKNKLYH